MSILSQAFEEKREAHPRNMEFLFYEQPEVISGARALLANAKDAEGRRSLLTTIYNCLFQFHSKNLDTHREVSEMVKRSGQLPSQEISQRDYAMLCQELLILGDESQGHSDNDVNALIDATRTTIKL